MITLYVTATTHELSPYFSHHVLLPPTELARIPETFTLPGTEYDFPLN
jgi:hypothetical protein